MKPTGKFVIAAVLAAPLLFGVALDRATAQQPTAPAAANPWPNVFKSPQGFSISYPNGWLVASKDQLQSAEQKVEPYLQNMGNLDLNKVAVFVFDPASGGGFSDNVNVIVTPQRLSINMFTQAQMRSEVDHVGQNAGSTSTNVKIDTETLAGRQVMVVKYDVTMVGNPLSMIQVAIPDGEQTLVVTGTCLQSRSSQEAPVFDAMINSVIASLPPDTGSGSTTPPWLIGAIVGGLVGLFGAVIGGLAKSRSNNSSASPPGGYQQPPWQQPGGYQQPGAYQQPPWPPQQPPSPGGGYQQPPAPPQQGQWPTQPPTSTPPGQWPPQPPAPPPAS